jgi:hypothetical protein
MAQVELYTSQSGQYTGGKWEPYKGATGFASTTAARLSALLRGQSVVNFDEEDDEAIISLSGGAKLHIRARSQAICQVDYRVVGKRYD